jgi:hypothetical protein
MKIVAGTQSRAVAARQVHTLEAGGSNPPSATKYKEDTWI